MLGRVDFLYVADSKLCSRQAMGHIAGGGGRFVTVMPRSRKEDGAFRGWLQSHTPVWTEAARGPGPRLGEPDEVYSTRGASTPSERASPSLRDRCRTYQRRMTVRDPTRSSSVHSDPPLPPRVVGSEPDPEQHDPRLSPRERRRRTSTPDTLGRISLPAERH